MVSYDDTPTIIPNTMSVVINMKIIVPNVVKDKRGKRVQSNTQTRLRNGLKIQSPSRARSTFLSARHSPV